MGVKFVPIMSPLTNTKKKGGQTHTACKQLQETAASIWR